MGLGEARPGEVAWGGGGDGDGGGCTTVSVVDRMCQVYLRAYPVHACAYKNDDRSHHYKNKNKTKNPSFMGYTIFVVLVWL